MSIKDIILARDNAQIVTSNVPGIGPVRIRRLKAKQMLDLANLPPQQATLVMIAASVCDDDGEPVFVNAAAVEVCDWGIVQALAKAVPLVNSLDVESAAKN